MMNLREAIPDCCLHAREITAEREIVIVSWEGSGTHAGPAFDPLQLGLLQAGSGVQVAVAGHSVIKVEKGRIAGEWVWSTKRQHQTRDQLIKRFAL
jgi:hypothetical protein